MPSEDVGMAARLVDVVSVYLVRPLTTVFLKHWPLPAGARGQDVVQALPSPSVLSVASVANPSSSVVIMSGAWGVEMDVAKMVHSQQGVMGGSIYLFS